MHLNEIIERIRIIESSLTAEDKQLMWQQIMLQTTSSKHKTSKRLLLWSASVAAVISVIVLSSLYFLETKPRSINYDTFITQDINDSQNIQLILSNDEVLQITTDNAELVYNQEGELACQGQIASSDQAGSTPSELNQLLVPYGKMSSVILSDGTKVWVNSGSQLIYPNKFTQKYREIYVKGEVYLEVAHNVSKPFIVKTDQLEINVTGTSFNVQAYPDMKKHSVVLAEGSVAVKPKSASRTFTVSPSQMFTYNNDDGLSGITSVDIYDHICWKYGFLHFTSEKIDQVLIRLARYYNVQFSFDFQTTKEILVSGKLDLKEDLLEVLNSISLTAPIQFYKNENTISVQIKS